MADAQTIGTLVSLCSARELNRHLTEELDHHGLADAGGSSERVTADLDLRIDKLLADAGIDRDAFYIIVNHE